MPGAFSTVSSLVPSPVPAGNADTITNALGPFRNAPERALIYKAASTGFFTYDEPSCGGGRLPGNSLLPGAIGGGAGLAGAFLKAGTGAAKALPVIGGLLEAFTGILGAHHAAAVQTEQATLCATVPEFNNFLASVDQAMQQGLGDFPTAIQALEAAYTTFEAKLKPITKKCNAACVYLKTARAAVEMRKQAYAIGAASNSAGSQGVIGGVVSAVGGAFHSLTNVFAAPPSSAPGGTLGGGVPLLSSGGTPRASQADFSTGAPTANASLFGASGPGLTQAQAKLGIVLVVGALFVGGMIFIVRAKKGG